MAVNYGKKFEEQFRKDWALTMPNTFLLRVPDQVSGFKTTSKNICDFIAFNGSKLLLIETKSHLGNYFPFDCLSQYDKLIENAKYENVIAGVIIWFRDHDKIIYAPIQEIEKIKNDGKASISIKMVNEKVYNLIEISSIKKRTMMTSDYSVFKEM